MLAMRAVPPVVLSLFDIGARHQTTSFAADPTLNTVRFSLPIRRWCAGSPALEYGPVVVAEPGRTATLPLPCAQSLLGGRSGDGRRLSFWCGLETAVMDSDSGRILGPHPGGVRQSHAERDRHGTVRRLVGLGRLLPPGVPTAGRRHRVDAGVAQPPANEFEWLGLGIERAGRPFLCRRTQRPHGPRRRDLRASRPHPRSTTVDVLRGTRSRSSLGTSPGNRRHRNKT